MKNDVNAVLDSVIFTRINFKYYYINFKYTRMNFKYYRINFKYTRINFRYYINFKYTYEF